MPKVELLSPAGNLECLKAAVQNGADSVYFGVDKFNARFYATNFGLDSMKEAIAYCKIRKVKTHLTLNTLIKNSEFEDAVDLAKSAYEAGIDAIIIQDLGLAKYLIDNIPELPVHASTQMTAHNLQGVQELEKLGFKRVVLARELSINEIEHICSNTDVEIETFIHGALCICYSGQCLFSSVVGGRSGNRGKCAGPCRLPYELLAVNDDATNSECKSAVGDFNKIENKNLDKNTQVLDKGYLLSPKDLCGLAYLPRLIKAGVKCFKIEGRMKSPEYVATVTRIYRKYIDMVLNDEEYIIDEQDINDLMQIFNRGGFSNGHLDSNANRNLVFPNKPNHMGICLGTIEKYNANKGLITLKLEAPLDLGDSVSVQKEDSKYLVSELMINNQNIKTANAGTRVTIGRMKGKISIRDKVYKVSSKKLDDSARASYENCENRKVALDCIITIKKDTPIKMELLAKNEPSSSIYHNAKVEVISDTVPIDALKTPISVERVIKQISKTNNTPYTFENITVYLDDGLYVPSISSLNEIRRNAISKMEQEIKNRMVRKSPVLNFNKEPTITYIPTLEHPKISLFLRNLFDNYDYSKLEHNKIDRIYLALKLFVDKNYTATIQYLSENYDLYIYLPTIIKSNYKNIIVNSLDAITANFNIKGFVLSNIADFEFLKRYRGKYNFVGNYSLNVFNNYTMEEYKKLGLNRITLSRELNQDGLNEILNTSNIDTELIVYGNLPIMATNYCFLGKTNHCYPECGLNCKKDCKYYLKDRLGFEFRILPDSFQTVSLICNSKTLSITTKELPVTSVRLDMIDETIEQINEAVNKAYFRERLEGLQYTNGNLYKEV